MKETLKKYTPEWLWNILKVINKYRLIIVYRFWARPLTTGETTKAKSRRIREGFFDIYCTGRGLDIGFGGDLIVENADGFDFEHGDGQVLKNIDDEAYDFVYSSHTIEHLPDPSEAIKNWFRVLKPGGYLIVYLPHRDLYEKKKTLPSRFNPTHLNYFLLDQDEEPDTIGIVPLIKRTLTGYEIIYAKDCSEGHTITDPLIHSDGEYSIEVVVKKN
jgi:SAM-dependent methyltransferase